MIGLDSFASCLAGPPAGLPRDFDRMRHHRNVGDLIGRLEAAPPGEISVDGIRLFIGRGVFNPALGSFSRVLGGIAFARAAAGARVLDVGTGSGYLAIGLAKRGAEVVASDADAALRPIIAEQARANGVEVDYRPGAYDDVYAGLRRGERFDLIVANLPFSREPLLRQWRSSAYHGSFSAPAGLVGSLVRRAADHLAPGGELLFCYGSSGWMGELDEALASTPGRLRIHWMDQTVTRSQWRFVLGIRRDSIG